MYSHRVKEVKAQNLPIIDVDGSCLAQQGVPLQPLPIPDQPLTGWRVLNQQSIPTLLDRIPKVASGTLYKYLSCGENQSKTFRALFKGYNQWASGRIERIEININNPLYCFVRCAVIPSMKDGTYKTTLLLRKAPTGYETVQTATCECAAG